MRHARRHRRGLPERAARAQARPRAPHPRSAASRSSSRCSNPSDTSPGDAGEEITITVGEQGSGGGVGAPATDVPTTTEADDGATPTATEAPGAPGAPVALYPVTTCCW